MVSELVAVACLQELLQTEHAPVVESVRRRILRDLKHRCRALELCTYDEKVTADSALRVLDSAVKEAGSR